MKKSGVISILLSAICFAVGGVLIKSVNWGSFSINGGRCIFAFIVMLIYMKATKHKFVMNKEVILGALANFGMCLTFVAANKLTTAANAIVLQFTMPAFVIIFLMLFWKKKPEKIEIITVCISFLGMLCFFYESLSAGGMLGNIIAVISGALYAVVFLLKKIPGADFESSVLVSHVISVIVGLPFIIRETDFGYSNILWIALLGIVQLGAAYVFLTRGLSTVPPVAASLISMIEPILNPILVAIVCGEMIGPISLIGALIVLGSATVYNVVEAKKSQEKAYV